MDDNFDSLVKWPFIALLLAAMITAFLSLAYLYKRGEDSAIENTYRKEAVTSTVDEMGDESKDYILGSNVLNEVLSFPDGTYIKINSTVINNLQTKTGDDYLTYARKYGTDLLESQISMTSTYKRQAQVDDDGNIIGVTYTIAY